MELFEIIARAGAAIVIMTGIVAAMYALLTSIKKEEDRWKD